MEALSILEKNVVQTNPLIEARKYMNLSELRLFCLGLQDIHPHIKDDKYYDVDFKETYISHKDLEELFQGHAGGVGHLKKYIKKAFDGKIEIILDNKGSFMLLHIYQKLIYEEGKGLIIKFDSEMKPYILNILQQAYTSYKVKNVFPLSSEYSWRIMELLLEKQGYFKKGHKAVYQEITIDNLRFKLNIANNLYKGRIDNFKRKVLDSPIKEINEKTDYYVWYNVIKTGRKVTAFKLWMKYKEGIQIEAEKEPPASDKDALTEAMKVEGMPKAAINTWLKKYGLKDVAASWQLAVEHANSRTETQGKGTQRKKYLKACMERNIVAINRDEAALKAEIDAREKRLAEEKEARKNEDMECIKKLGGFKPSSTRTMEDIAGGSGFIAELAKRHLGKEK